ncbi:MAG TPA: VanZ family protein [Ginsengibacter sp.]|jgi:VanZ family protein
MQKISIKKFLPGIAWFFLVLVLTCLPGNDLPKIGWLDKIYFDKWVHIGMFGGLTFLFCWPFYKSQFSNRQRLYYFIKITIAVSIWGLTIEFIQKFYVTGRSFDLLDWAADSLGAFIAFLFCRKWFIKTSPESIS